MNGGGSKKGRKLSQYRRCNFWPRAKDQVALDNCFATWRFVATHQWATEKGYRQNVRCAL